MRNKSGATRRELNMQLRDASSVGAVAAAALEQGPKKSVCVRVKEGPKELIPRYGFVSESSTTNSDLAESAPHSSSVEEATAILLDDRRDVL